MDEIGETELIDALKNGTVVGRTKRGVKRGVGCPAFSGRVICG